MSDTLVLVVGVLVLVALVRRSAPQLGTVADASHQGDPASWTAQQWATWDPGYRGAAVESNPRLLQAIS